jgi:hypothetical protein
MKAKNIQNVDINLLRSLLRYDAETGKMIWREREPSMFDSAKRAEFWNMRYAGKEAMSYIHNGYRSGTILGVAREAHRIAWAIHYGFWPKHYIDHINGDRSDNRISNLRDVPQRINLSNTKAYKSNSSGVTGVGWHKSARKWKASICVSSVHKHLGLFDEFADAVHARSSAEKEFGYHANHGRT